MKKLLFITFLLLCCTSQSFAIDGKRKGFTLGAGVNFAPYSKWELTTPSVSKTSIAYGINAFAGYNFDNKNLIAWQLTANSKFWDGVSAHAQLFNGLVWNHYLKTNVGDWFSTIGAGQLISGVSYSDPNVPTVTDEFGFVLSANSKFPSLQSSFGYLFGGGYELSKHWHLSLYYYTGIVGDTQKHNVISVSLTRVAF